MGTFFLAPWWNKITNSMRTTEINPLSSQYVGETLANVTLSSTADYYYYVDMASFRKSGFQFEITMGAGSSATVTIWGSLQDDGTVPASCTYQNITSSVLGTSGLTCPAATTTSDMWIDNSEKLACFKYLRIKVAYTHSANSTVVIYHKRLY